MSILSRLTRFANRPSFAVGLALMLVVAMMSSFSAGPARASYISVSVTFTNTGKLPLYRTGGQLDHGCWNPEPPGSIAPFATVTWESDSCGVATGTEGWVDYKPYGAPDGVVGHFYWDDPFIGSNSATDAAPTGCTSSHSGPGSGDNVTVFFTMGCSDSSGDGIADVWKLHGASFDPGGGAGIQFIDLAAMGASVGQKDIFIQLDWMQDATHNQQLSANTIKSIVNTFAANGFALHVDAGPNSILNFATNSTWGALSRASSTPYQASLGTTTLDASGNLKTYDWTAFNTIKAAKFTPTGRTQVFHYVLAARQLGSVTNSGISRAADVIISLGAFTSGVGSDNEQLGTLMHELGHNLGLDHGGDSSVNYKPNYFSIMNYAFQLSGITNGGVTTFDYSHKVDSQLNENNGLNETSGVSSGIGFATVHYCPAAGGNPAARITVPNATGAIDWDCDGAINATSLVGADINGDPAQAADTRQTLTGYDDWDHLKLASGAIGSFGAPVPEPPITTIVDDPTPEMEQEILPIDTTAPKTTASAAPSPNSYGWNNTSVVVTLSATDDISGVARTEFNLDGAGWTQYTSPVTVSGDAIHTLQYRSIDRASNIETAKSLTVKVDATPPTVTHNGNAGTYHILDTVNITCTASDNLSGVRVSTCEDIIGPAYNFEPGTNTFSATATDYADNVGSGSTSFDLVVTYGDLCTLSKQFVTNAGVAMSNGMCAQLFAARSADSNNNLTAKTNTINAYLNDVDAAVNGHYLSPTNAAILKKLAGGL